MRKQNSIVNFVLCTAEAGCGKTTFICHYYLRHLPRLCQFNFAFSVGSFSGAEQTIVFLKCFCMRILSFFKFFQYIWASKFDMAGLNDSTRTVNGML